jgi:hypothetical protein
MVEMYNVHSTSRQSAVGEGRVLSSTSTTRKFLLWELVTNPHNPEAKVKATLVHQRKTPRGTWENEPSPSLCAIKAGEARKFILDSEETLNLHKELNNLFAIGDEMGIRPGDSRLVVAPEAEVIVTDRNRATIIKSLLSKGYSDEIWHTLIETHPDLATRLAYARIQSERSSALDTFEKNLKLGQGEPWWQDFFESNTWIFGYGLNYRILKSVQAQPSYGGVNFGGRGMQRGDFLQRTEAFIRFTVLVEIKKPDTALFGATQYRNGAWQLSEHLTGGLSQLQGNCSKWEKEGSQTEANREGLLRQRIFTIQPKGILVIGHTNQLTDQTKRNTFELFRRSIVNPVILTFDELCERAKFIVESTKENAEAQDDDATETQALTDDDIPF